MGLVRSDWAEYLHEESWSPKVICRRTVVVLGRYHRPAPVDGCLWLMIVGEEAKTTLQSLVVSRMFPELLSPSFACICSLLPRLHVISSN